MSLGRLALRASAKIEDVQLQGTVTTATEDFNYTIEELHALYQRFRASWQDLEVVAKSTDAQDIYRIIAKHGYCGELLFPADNPVLLRLQQAVAEPMEELGHEELYELLDAGIEIAYTMLCLAIGVAFEKGLDAPDLDINRNPRRWYDEAFPEVLCVGSTDIPGVLTLTPMQAFAYVAQCMQSLAKV